MSVFGEYETERLREKKKKGRKATVQGLSLLAGYCCASLLSEPAGFPTVKHTYMHDVKKQDGYLLTSD